MTKRKCLVKDCSSEEGLEKDEGVTFHRFPQTNAECKEKWINGKRQLRNSFLKSFNITFLVCKLGNFKPTKYHFICSRHFRRENFTVLQSGKIILKSLTVPSIFPWNKEAIVVKKETIISSPNNVNEKKKEDDEKDEQEEEQEQEEEVVMKENKEEEKEIKKDSKKKVRSKEPVTPVTHDKPKKSSKRLSERFAANSAKKKKTEVEVVEVKPKVPETPPSAKKNNEVTTFLPGKSIEAQNFDGKWIPVKVIEVDMDDREVLVRSIEKNNKSKSGTNDEWISMDSPRLRPCQPGFEVGDRVMAKWNDCRKFPGTIKKVLDNDTYDILFDDGYQKIVRFMNITKCSPGKGGTNKSTIPDAPLPSVINPLYLNPPSLIPDYIKEMKDLPTPPTEGEWCCLWVDDIPVGEESSFDGTHDKVPSIIVPDWRVKEGWQKHIYLRLNGKWDILFISPTNRKLRTKNELKIYLAEIGETYDPETWDFSLQKKRSKALNLCIQSEKVKQQQVLPSNLEVKAEMSQSGAPVFNNPLAALGALPYVQPNLVQSVLSTHTEVSVGSLKVKVVNNVFHCPATNCDKQFRKENHLQLHIKHYHEDLAKLMGECPNMEDLAYLRTSNNDEAELSLIKAPPRKSHVPSSTKSTPTISSRAIKSEPRETEVIKFNQQRSPILEEALKAPLITLTPKKDPYVKLESISASALAQFDPETLIPPHAVRRPNAKHHRMRRVKIRFNPKSKKSMTKRSREEIGSTVEGVIPYNEGPYLKSQTGGGSYVDENGEVIKIVRMKKEEIINCICGYGEEDGLMIQCDVCLCWQHGWCHGIESSNQVPEKYICLICKNPYRQRLSMRFIHDQDWLYDGKLPIASYHPTNPKQVTRVETLKNCHTLIGNLMEMKRFMKSLDVKINIAQNVEHPKLYLWSKKWEESPPRDVEMKDDIKRDIKFEEDIKTQHPVAPEPEAAIEPTKCRQTLLDHIQYQQDSVKSRLDNVEREIEGKLSSILRYIFLTVSFISIFV